VIEPKTERYYLSQAYRWESSIAIAFQALFEKALITPMNQEVDVNSMRSHKGHKLVREQKIGVRGHLTFPIFIINGPGGSGYIVCSSSLFF